jgi:RNA polymerase sigma factor (sigma-70 family)
MAATPPSRVLGNIRRWAAGRPGLELTDSQLLERYVGQHDQAAFAGLVRRHGSLVWGVCRHLLHHQQDAEDAFQATFLVLAQKATSIRQPGAVAAWLHGVARRSALQIRRAAARRRVHEQQAPGTARPDPQGEVAWRELQAILDEELHGLPEKYRAPFVLCCLEGRSKAEAARELGWKEGTVSGRLARARKFLQHRLTRRGVSLSAVLCAIELSRGAARAAVPVALVRSAARTGLQATGAVPAAVVMKGMALTRLTPIALFLVVAGGLVAGAWVLTNPPVPPRPGGPAVVPTADGRRPGPPEKESPRGDEVGEPLPPGAHARLGTLRLRHGGHVSAIAFAPDGKILASGGGDDAVRLWDPRTGIQIRALLGHADRVCSLAFAPDGKTLASAGANDRTVRIWEVATGKELRVLKHAESLTSVAFRPDGKELAVGTWRDAIHVWDPATGKHLRTLTGHRQRISALAYAPDGKTLASAGWEDRTVRLWDVGTGKEIRRFGHTGCQAHTLAFAPDGKVLATGGGGAIILWDVRTGREVRRCTGPASGTASLHFSRDGKRLASGDFDRTVRVWDPASGRRVLPSWRQHDLVYAVCFSPDGRWLASGGEDNQVRLRDVATGKQILPAAGPESGVSAVALPAGGRTALSACENGTVHVWERATGKELQSGGPFGRPACVALTADGRRVAAWGWADRALRVRESATGNELWRHETSRLPSRLAFSPDGSLLAWVDDKGVQVWRADTGKPIALEEHSPDGVGPQAAFSADGRTLALGTWRLTDEGKVLLMVRFWDLTAGKSRDLPLPGRPLRKGPRRSGPLVFPLATGNFADPTRPDRFIRIALSPDGYTLAAAGPDSDIRVWEVASGQERFRLRGHRFRITALAFSPDGRHLVSGGEDRPVRIWDTLAGAEEHRLGGHRGPVTALAFSADGQSLVTGSADTTALVWEGLLPRRAPALSVALTAEEGERLWHGLLGDAGRAQGALRVLVQSPEDGVALLAKHLRPVPTATPERLARLIADLDSDRFPVREKATRDLEELGEGAEAALRKVQTGRSSAEVRRRVGQLLARLEDGNPEQLRTLRALEVLTRIGTPRARQALRALADGAPGAWQTRQARAALERRRSAKPR